MHFVAEVNCWAPGILPVSGVLRVAECLDHLTNVFRVNGPSLASFCRSVISKPRLVFCSAPFPSSVTTTDVSPLTPLQNVLQSLPASCPLSAPETPAQPGSRRP